MSVIPLYGGLSDFGYYFADVLIGTPSQRMSVILDTGSEGLSVTCSTCEHCGTKHMDPLYNPGASLSFIDENQCFSRHWIRAPVCVYEKKYLEGSSLVGRFATDFVKLGQTQKRIRFGCIESETKLFLEQRANGILGLAPSIRTYWFTQGLPEEIDTFSVCLATHGGDLEFFSSNLTIDLDFKLEYVDNHYVVKPATVEIDGDAELDLDAILGDQVLFDTGSTVTYLNDFLFRKISSIVSERASAAKLKLDYLPVRDPTMCWISEAPFSEFLNLLPKIVFVFTSETGYNQSLTFHNYAFIDANNRYCLRIASNGSLRRTDLGAPFMVGKKFFFTPRKGKFGFIDSANCTERVLEDRLPVEPVPNQLTANLVSHEPAHATEFFIVFFLLVSITASALLCIVRRSVYRPMSQELEEFHIGSPNSQLE